MRLLLLSALLMASLAGCTDDVHEAGPSGQVDGAALNHVLVPYSGAVVRIPELDLEATTTDLGGFSFFQVPVGMHVVELEIPGVGIDREIVAVNEDQITRVILQIYPDDRSEPHVTLRSDVEIVELAMPGESCPECDWRTTVSEAKPAAVELLVEWDARHPIFAAWRTELNVELWDESNNLVAGPLTKYDVVQVGDNSVLHTLIPASQLRPDISSLKVAFSFDASNPAPHPDFQVDSRLCLHYVETEHRTACSI